MRTFESIMEFTVAEKENLETAKHKYKVMDLDLAVLMNFGSVVYGTNTEKSDLDLKAVYIPSSNDILFQQVQPTLRGKTNPDKTKKNSADDMDIEIFSFGRYLEQTLEGQTIALDMLFVPYNQYQIVPSDAWMELVNNRDRLVSKEIKPFINYCLDQAGKYGIKGSRVKAAQVVVDFLRKQDPEARLSELPLTPFWDLCAEEKVSTFIEICHINGPIGAPEPHLSVCKKKCPLRNKVKKALPIYEAMVESYGMRARQAATHEGVDWKSLSHAVRIIEQALELLATKHITFPRPNAKELLDIKEGRKSFAEVSAMIEAKVDELEAAVASSDLQDKPDEVWAKDRIRKAYAVKIITSMHTELCL